MEAAPLSRVEPFAGIAQDKKMRKLGIDPDDPAVHEPRPLTSITCN
jgi:hypothetical protein